MLVLWLITPFLFLNVTVTIIKLNLVCGPVQVAIPWHNTVMEDRKVCGKKINISAGILTGSDVPMV